MKILHWDFPAIFDSYYDKCINQVSKIPSWFYIDQIKEEPHKSQYSESNGVYDPDSGNIFLKRTMPSDEALIIAAHELTHATQIGFPIIGVKQSDENLRSLGGTIRSTLLDVLVLRELEQYGFDMSIELNNNYISADNIKYYFEYGPKYKPEYICINLSLYYVRFYYYFRYNENWWKDILNRFVNKLPYAKTIGDKLVEISESTGFTTPQTMEVCINKWLLELGLSEYIEVSLPC